MTGRPLAPALARVRRAAQMPPGLLLARSLGEARTRLDRLTAARAARGFDEVALAAATGSPDLALLWDSIGGRPYPFVDTAQAAHAAVALDAGELERVLAAAELALDGEVDLLGSGTWLLGTVIDWHVDPKTGRRWPLAFGRSLDVANLGEPSDVKLPWELSRLQWLLPAGQAYLLTGEERYARRVRDVLEQWMVANPYPLGPNWAVAMEAGMRIITWTWLARACRESAAFSDRVFRASLLRSVYLHGRFVERYLERSSINGNHFTADAAGLVFAGLYLGAGTEPLRWAATGWRILEAELPRQVTDDGVDFEGSVPYHRLVCELFLLPALYRRSLGLEVPDAYWRRLEGMAAFSATVTRPDGTTPVVGDNDDARALPLGTTSLGDHRYLAGILASVTGSEALSDGFAGPRAEAGWIAGPDVAASLPERRERVLPSRAFADSGVYVLSGTDAHVVIDCGPVGLGGRGGHGHNDCLSFEAWLEGAPLIVDSGCEAYTGSPEWRNRLRATAAHNTPIVDGAEQNRLDPTLLWTLRPDATPHVRMYRETAGHDLLVASHDGYLRLSQPVTPVRLLALDRAAGVLVVLDRFEGAGDHELRIPFHLAPGTDASEDAPGRWRLRTPAATFCLVFDAPTEWTAHVERSWFAPSYGVRLESRCLELRRSGPLVPVIVAIGPERLGPELLARARGAAAEEAG